MTALRRLYKDVELLSPDSAKGFSLLESMADPQTPYRSLALTSLRIDGTSSKDWHYLPRGRKGSSIVDAILEQCLPEQPPPNAHQDVRDTVEEAYSVCRASLYASTCIGPASIALAITLAKNIKSIEWMMIGTGLTCTPLKLIKLVISAKVACSLPVFPTLCHLEWRLDNTDACVPIVPSLKRLIIHGSMGQNVSFDLTAMVNDTKSQLMEVIMLGMDMTVPLTELSNLGHLHHLRSLRMRDFSRDNQQNYHELFKLLNQNSPQLETVDLDFEYTDFGDRTQETVPKSLQPQLDLLTNLKHAKVHSQLLWSSPFDMNLSEMYDALPPNLEYLVLVGLDLGAILQLDEDENDEEMNDENDEEMEYETTDTNGDIVVADEVDNEILERSDPDPFSIRHLRTVLPYLTRVGFRFDFNVTTISDLDQELQLADRALRSLVASAKALGITLGIYVCCMESDSCDIFYMGDDIQVAQIKE
ncbi:hypothetical protein J3E72DRAFT_273654 [Bipolaris maydis]|nr:hypothetical protein J3E74DRAFT_295886 [Bipolaris maydis]KAJ5052649.1 hypothetical protein J3E74DRAFT_412150 [Bipolaris maydis]KAJ6192319.1 hypothetical protein J3E72DRAFT_273654 [Bipolaris maydis]